ncbi:MAG TPA: ribonuclease J [Candidatus Paceibacterota bacterium]
MENIRPLKEPLLRKRTEKTLHQRVIKADNSNKALVQELRSGSDIIRVIPLGGVEEVGRNMIIIEVGEDIFISDMGFEFVTEVDTPGISYVLPNVKYLEARKKKIRAVFITHGHLDHIGGIPYIMPRIGNPPIYTRELTALMIKKRQDEFPELAPLDIKMMEPGKRIKIGSTYVEAFAVTHSIPDSMGLKIETKYGNIVLSGDLKLDHHDGVPTKEEQDVWGKVGKEKNILFIADSTNAERPGWSITEREVVENIEEIIRGIKGRIIVGTFASQFARMIKIIQIAERMGRKVVTDGRSIKTNIDVALAAGMLKPEDGDIVDVRQIEDYPPDKVLVLATGAQGEEFAALGRASRGVHKHLKFKSTDTIIFSSSVIPGNEVAVQELRDNLYKYNVHIINYRTSDVHSTGHGNAGELVWINQQVNAKYFMPGYGYRSMLHAHADATIEAGRPKDKVILAENGSIIDIIDENTVKVHKEKVPADPMFVDGTTVSDGQSPVVNDRKVLSQDGIFVVIAVIDTSTGKVRRSPDIISRGFVYMKESQELLKHARGLTKRMIEETASRQHPVNMDFLKSDVREKLSRFLLQKTGKRPIVLPVILET